MESNVISVFATKETRKKLQEAKDARDKSKSQLEEKKGDIEELNKTKTGLQSELSSLNSQLQTVSDNLVTIEGNINSKQAEIDQTKKDLEEAIETQKKQYAAMKKRVQFIYESQSFMMIELMLSSKSFADFLNNSEYVAQLSAYDRKQLINYQQICQSITDKSRKLDADMKSLEDLKKKQETEQSRVSTLVNNTSSSISQYSDQINSAQAQADALKESIEKQNENIEALQKKLEEEIRMSKLAARSKWRDISQVSFAEGDRYLLANLIYCEAGGEPYSGQVAVGAVVINRVRSSIYPDTVVGVIYQRGQFEPVATGRLALALAQDKATSSCYKAADEAMAGYTNVGECVYFRTPIPGLNGTKIGGHIFY
ncbi:cell wall hydrolase [Butyrivibrio sp. NC3005]|uniref:cell wall hydrolase n=1 Tax=Butyrivibrio sp. NC3005 TaxID=1280685 RepID=UPI0018CB872E|nr:cell wall hydrolase [Butyrivibrio sp. NC3005]